MGEVLGERGVCPVGKLGGKLVFGQKLLVGSVRGEAMKTGFTDKGKVTVRVTESSRE